MRRFTSTLLVLSLGCATAPIPRLNEEDETYGVDELARDAKTLEAQAEAPWVKAWLAEAKNLPRIRPRTVYKGQTRDQTITEAQFEALADAEKSKFQAMRVDETVYYTTFFGQPLAYLVAYEALAKAGVAFKTLAPKRMLDFGYGSVGQLRMMAGLGTHAVGVDTSHALQAIYASPEDTGEVRGTLPGRLELFTGQFPAELELSAKVGKGYDLIVSKNVLKRGYIHPAEQTDPKYLVHLGVDDTTFLAALRDALVPGGHLLIYNICPPPAPPGKPYIPWADGHSPWTVEEWERAGFKVLAFDVVDDEHMRAMGRVLKWENVDTDYFAHYTLVMRPE